MACNKCHQIVLWKQLCRFTALRRAYRCWWHYSRASLHPWQKGRKLFRKFISEGLSLELGSRLNYELKKTVLCFNMHFFISEVWCWRRLLRVPWTARRSNQSILKETSPGCSSEGLMLMLKLQYFGHLMRRADSFEKTLMLGKIGGRRRRGQQRMRQLDGITDSMTWVWVNSRSWWWIGRPGVLQFMESQRVGHDWVTELNWTLFVFFF